MTREIDLRRAIIDDPDNDDLRLVYADWCEEHGDVQRAEFIRVQIRLAIAKIPRAERQELEEREQELRDTHTEGWLQSWSEETTAVEFRRGFAEHLTCYGEDGAAYLLKHGSRLFQREPITSLWLCPQGGIYRGNLPWEFRTEKADIDRLRRDQFLELLRSPFLSQLRCLDLGPSSFGEGVGVRGTVIGNLLGDDAVEALADCPHVKNLRVLRLGENALGNRAAFALADSPYVGSLRTLDLWGNLMTRAVLVVLDNRFPQTEISWQADG